MSYKTKEAARQYIKTIGEACPSDEKATASEKISSNLLAVVQGELPVLGFVPHGNNEPDIKDILTELALSERLYLPYWEPTQKMTFYKATKQWSASIQENSKHGAKKISPNAEPFKGGDGYILVPAVAFDTDMNRLGRGGGYYDKFLASNQAMNLYKIGIAYRYQILSVGSFPVLKNDIKVDRVISA